MTRATAYYILNATSIEFTEYGPGGGIYIMFFVVRDGVVTNPQTLLQSIRRCARRGVYNIMRCRGIRLRGGLNIHDGWIFGGVSYWGEFKNHIKSMHITINWGREIKVV